MNFWMLAARSPCDEIEVTDVAERSANHEFLVRTQAANRNPLPVHRGIFPKRKTKNCCLPHTRYSLHAMTSSTTSPLQLQPKRHLWLQRSCLRELTWTRKELTCPRLDGRGPSAR